eukprot:CAMPEP_0184479206 /NCGR_PEP_ID=MMETSP0113_2-20130426/1021_1 /TAXON_ID=91329 /ORGANISM="Norrisiella sphaerica, Strain BC52" /LENGTH=459 /DNA_ID=CAMNT_0026857237 /DNA_START=271 /DNA_END=1650 /DNA_ORIENTATION=-
MEFRPVERVAKKTPKPTPAPTPAPTPESPSIAADGQNTVTKKELDDILEQLGFKFSIDPGFAKSKDTSSKETPQPRYINFGFPPPARPEQPESSLSTKSKLERNIPVQFKTKDKSGRSKSRAHFRGERIQPDADLKHATREVNKAVFPEDLRSLFKEKPQYLADLIKLLRTQEKKKDRRIRINDITDLFSAAPKTHKKITKDTRSKDNGKKMAREARRDPFLDSLLQATEGGKHSGNVQTREKQSDRVNERGPQKKMEEVEEEDEDDDDYWEEDEEGDDEDEDYTEEDDESEDQSAQSSQDEDDDEEYEDEDEDESTYEEEDDEDAEDQSYEEEDTSEEEEEKEDSLLAPSQDPYRHHGTRSNVGNRKQEQSLPAYDVRQNLKGLEVVVSDVPSAVKRVSVSQANRRIIIVAHGSEQKRMYDFPMPKGATEIESAYFDRAAKKIYIKLSRDNVPLRIHL